ncbi:MAG: TonB family protein [Bryobacteraceae bacterium]
MQLGQYEVWEEIGRGGMGVVYRGYDPLIGREVALKTIHLYAIADPRERQDMQDRLQREAQSAGRLSHPNIVTIYQIGYAELQPGQTTAFLAMEFVPGANLAALLDSLRAGPPERIVDYLRQAAAALDYAHSRGVIHRDIKPANLLVTPEGMLKIADFGVAKIVTQTVTMTGTVLGSPAYMSPEQIKAEPVDGRTDQYSLAVVAYELFTGQKPFEADTLSALVYKIAQQPPPPLRTVPPELAGRIGPVLLRAMAKDPAARYATCTEFVEALAAALRSSTRKEAAGWQAPLGAEPANADPGIRQGRAVRVSPRALAAAGAVCAGLALLGWMAVSLREEAPKAQLPAATEHVQVSSAPAPSAAAPGASPATVAPQPAGNARPQPLTFGGLPEPKRSEPAPVRKEPASMTPPASARPEGKPTQPSVAKAAPATPPVPDKAPQSAPAKPEPQPSTPAAAVAEAKPEPAPAEPPPKAPEPRREPVRTPPRVTQTAPASYTPEALQKGLEGSVLLSVDIDEQGIPRRARILRSLDPGLDRKAIESLGGWRFAPATEDGRPVPSTANVEVNFTLVGAPRRTPPSLKSLK